MGEIRFVLLDAGGTLTVGVPSREERLQRACHYFNLTPAPDWQLARKGLQVAERFFIGAVQEGWMMDREAVREAVKGMLSAMGVWGKLDDPALLWDFLETQYETERLMDGALETLETLRQHGYRLAIASNAPPTYEGRLRELGLAQQVERIFLSDVIGYAKPDPRFFQFILERLKAVPEETVHVGNSYWHDVIGARRAGVTPIFFDFRDAFTDCDCPRITDLSQLPPLLQELTSFRRRF